MTITVTVMTSGAHAMAAGFGDGFLIWGAVFSSVMAGAVVVRVISTRGKWSETK